MSRLGEWSTILAAVCGLATVAVWNRGGAAATMPRAADGAQLFQAKGCAACHVGPAPAASAISNFPSLANVEEWAGERRPNLSVEEYLTESIAAPGVFLSPDFQVGQSGPATAMPQLRLTSDEIDALVGYLVDG